MELVDYVHMLRRQWIWVAGAVGIGLFLALLYLAVAPKTYRASAQLFFGSTVADHSSNADQSALAASQYVTNRMPSYAALITSPQVTHTVISDLALTVTPEALSQQLSATVPPGTVLLTIAASDTSPTMAARIADAAARELRSMIAAIDAPIPGTS